MHADLGTEHVLVDAATSRPVGLIDFEDATIGDPAIDFVGCYADLGPAGTAEVIAAYGPVDMNRVRDYWWLGSLQAILHGVHVEDADITEAGIDGLRASLP